MQKRISVLLLAMVIVISSVLCGNTLKVKAASATVAMSPELAAEFYMVLLQITETAMHVSGANNGLDSKEALEAIGDGVQGYFTTNMSSGIDFEIQTTDGETFRGVSDSGYSRGLVEYTTADGQTYKLSGDKFTSLLLNGKITLDPGAYNDTDETDTDIDQELDDYIKKRQALIDAKKDEMMEAYIASKQGEGSGEDPTPSPEPSPDPKKLFTTIKLVSLGASLIAVAGAFVKDLFDGQVEEIDPTVYYGQEYFTGELEKNADGNYFIHGYIKTHILGNDGSETYRFYTMDESYFYVTPMVAAISDSTGMLSLYTYNSSMSVIRYKAFYISYDINGKPLSSSTTSYISTVGSSKGLEIEYSLNIPVFDSQEHARAFFVSGDLTGLLNGETYDFPDLVKSVPEVLQPLTGTKFSPSLLPGINTAVSNAVKSLPETSTDTKTNTETYKETMTSTITDVAPKTEVVPEPTTKPDTDTDTGEGESYKRDLRLIFPFCIPFDFIHFIKALSADPVAPCFKIPIKLDSLGIDMVLELDLAWMDPVMEIFRLGELGCFVIMLMAATKKMIGW